MDARRGSRAVVDPKIRMVGFFTPPAPVQFEFSPSANSLSPVMIPPPLHSSENLELCSQPSVVTSPSCDEAIAVSRSLNSCSEEMFPASMSLSPSPVASTVARGGLDSTTVKSGGGIPMCNLTTVSVVNADSFAIDEREKPIKGGGSAVDVKDEAVNSKQKKDKSSKAERRALQEAQRAEKAAAKAEGNTASRTATSASVKSAKAAKPPHKAVNTSAAASEKKGGDRPSEKDRKKDVPHPRLQYDDKSRVEKAKRRAVVNQTESRNRVELFRHLPQYEHGSQLPDLEAKFFQLGPVHPSVYKVGLQYLSGDISGGNARCIAMLQAFQDAIKDYTVPLGKTLVRDLTAKISSYVSFLIECRPLSVSMGNAIRFLKSRISQLPRTQSESESKTSLQSDIERFIYEKIILADKMIVEHAVTKIRDGDVLLTYGSSSAVEMILLHAHKLGKQFRVVVVDSRPSHRGKLLLRRLVEEGLSCTYTHINAVSYIMHEVTRVFLGASSVLSNGTVYSGVGTACVAMIAHEFHVPVIVCCEAFKFHERVQLDSICSNELGDPDLVSKVSGRRDINHLDAWANTENLQLLNLIYDATPSDYVSMIVTDYGMIPPTSVPVVVREYNREHAWI
ncbi:probable translation initiation factor eIF-2B subunit delta isoform X1 [Vicia villosa]|uniref:probable translation initiation factor eIF-2B subunit delta isoform X1 n=1 Tax=Vicia villosa TaxID=3911 RepID=UPI00273C4786|nr:probable translation initiation factor eIF-2B subunit delta isoform X1 [Vicia villosa]